MKRFPLIVVLIGAIFSSGELRAAESPPPDDDAVQLPPFLVEEPAYNPVHWLYAHGDDLEILSAGEEQETVEFVQEIRARHADLNHFVPAEFLFRPRLPTTLILFPRSLLAQIDAEMVKELKAPLAASGRMKQFIPMQDLRLADADSIYIFVILNDRAWKAQPAAGPSGAEVVGSDSYLQFMLESLNPAMADGPSGSQVVESPSYLQFLLASRIPALPDWYINGIVSLYQGDQFPGLHPLPFMLELFGSNRRGGKQKEVNGFDPDPWLSAAAAQELARDPSASRPLLPMKELFIPFSPTEKSSEYQRVWAAQCELFIRWIYSNQMTDGPERLRRFVTASLSEPVTDAMFQSYFETNFADARDRLSDFLPQAIREPLKIPYVAVKTPTPIELRSAQPFEIRRIKGEWARRTLKLIAKNYPVALPRFVEKTRKLLFPSDSSAIQDPPLLASQALFLAEIGENAAAAKIFEADAQVAAARPSASFVFQELQVQNLVQAAPNPQAKLTEAQAGKILREIDQALQAGSPIEAEYVLLEKILGHLDRDASAAERSRLNEGVKLFPRNPQLAFTAASWDLRAGDKVTADALIELACRESNDPAVKGKLLSLRVSGPGN